MINPQLNKDIFSGLPKDYYISEKSKYVFVSDLFVEDITGGAELTTEALIEHKKDLCSKIHASSLTINLLNQNKDKHFILCNFSSFSNETTKFILNSDIKYSMIEYDFKFCKFRSPYRHLLEINQKCECSNEEHGKTIGDLFLKAQNIFWMSQKQKEINEEKYSFLKEKKNSFVISSIFDKTSLNLLKQLSTTEKNDKYALVKSSSWLKGVDNSKAFLEYNNIKHDIIEEKNYKKFLRILSQYKGLIFQPVEWDTCPRLVIEAKLLGLELILNKNVLHKDEQWFKLSKEDMFSYLETNVNKFWENIIL